MDKVFEGTYIFCCIQKKKRLLSNKEKEFVCGIQLSSMRKVLMKEFELKDLSEFDGKDGKPVYIAHQGRVYDVTLSKLWKGGLHMKRHHAGRDLSVDIGAAPHGIDVLERYPQVGILKAEREAEVTLPEVVSRLLHRFPILRRHPHPMTVHFPIVFMLATTAFNLLYLISHVKSFEVTALHCLGAGILFMPLVMLTGLFTWWLNYMAKPVRSVIIKIVVSPVLFVIALIAFTWRMANPELLSSFGMGSVIYFLLILSLTPLVGIIGWYGAQLTFPVEKE